MPFLNLLSWWISIFTLTPSLCLYVNSIKQQYQVATTCILVPHKKPKEHLNSLHGWNFCLLRIREVSPRREAQQYAALAACCGNILISASLAEKKPTATSPRNSHPCTIKFNYWSIKIDFYAS